MEKDYYGILKVDEKADPAKIKRAYRKAAKQYHPDISHEDEERFKEVQEAYETLSDPEKKADYDRQHIEKLPFDDRVYHHPDLLSPSHSLFDEIDQFFADFNNFWMNDQSGFFGGREEGSRNLFIEISLTPSEARNGCEIPLEVPFRVKCRRCWGTGNVGGLICGLCLGLGEEKVEKKIKIAIPSGARHGMEIKIPVKTPDSVAVYLIATLKRLKTRVSINQE
jgi:molecular chaperone DnaJ